MTINQAQELLAPFGSPIVTYNGDDIEPETVITVSRPKFQIEVTFDGCNEPRCKGWEDGKLKIDTRADLAKFLEWFNNN